MGSTEGHWGEGFPGFQSACPLEAAPSSQDLLAPAAHLVIPFMLPRNIYQAQIRVPGSGVQGGRGRGHLVGEGQAGTLSDDSALCSPQESGKSGIR